MITQYVDKFIQNLPEELKNNKKPLQLDLVLDGGVFNGSYLVGALYFLKEMEKQNYIKINRISGCSIGSVIAFMYMIDCLDISEEFYNIIFNQLKTSHNLSINEVLNSVLKNRIPNDICDKVNNKLFITYYNIKKRRQKIKCTYKNKEEIINTIIKSSYIPFVMDGNATFEKKYIDGMNPYIFKIKNDRKILHLDLYGYDKIGNLLNVKNEKTNYHRVLSGLLDIHSFFIKKCGTPMCSYVNNWSTIDICFNKIKSLAEKIIIYLVYCIILLKKNIPNEFKDTFLYKVFFKILYDIYVTLLENYCL